MSSSIRRAARRATRLERDVADLSNDEAARLLNTGGRIAFRCLDDAQRGNAIIEAAGPGRPIFRLVQHGPRCSPDVCRCAFVIVLERPDDARARELAKLGAEFARERLN